MSKTLVVDDQAIKFQIWDTVPSPAACACRRAERMCSGLRLRHSVARGGAGLGWAGLKHVGT